MGAYRKKGLFRNAANKIGDIRSAHIKPRPRRLAFAAPAAPRHRGRGTVFIVSSEANRIDGHVNSVMPQNCFPKHLPLTDPGRFVRAMETLIRAGQLLGYRAMYVNPEALAETRNA